MPFEPQAFTTHWLAVAQSAPVADAQVFAVALQRPEAHNAVAFAALQVPSWRPSLGIVPPAARFDAHVKACWSQCCPVAQSLSFQHPSAGTQVPLVDAQTPDWQSAAALSAVQPLSPFEAPHLPLEPQRLSVHSAASVHVVEFAAAQVLVTALQRPVTQAAFTADAPQVV